MAIQRGATHADRLGDLLHRVLAVGEHLARDTELVLGDDRRAAAVSPAGARGLQAGLGALADQLVLELRDRAEDMKHQPTRRGRGVDALGKAAEAELAALELADQLNQVTQRATETVQAPDHQRVLTVAQLPECRRELWPLFQRPRRGIAKAALAADRLERVELQREILIDGRDASVANQHPGIVSKLSDERELRHSRLEPTVAAKELCSKPFAALGGRGFVCPFSLRRGICSTCVSLSEARKTRDT